MDETTVSSLGEREQRQYGNARAAIDRGNHGYAVEICHRLLESSPECLEVRQTLRQAQRREYADRSGMLGKCCWKLAGCFLVMGGRIQLKKAPQKALVIGERVLCMDPYHRMALSLVAHGARVMELNETEAFCLESVCDRNPNSARLLERLCNAWIKVGETDKALNVAERLNRLKPGSTHVQELVKAASVAHSIQKGKWSEKEGDFRSKLKNRGEAESLEKSHRISKGEKTTTSDVNDLIELVHEDPQKLDTYKTLVRSLISKEDYGNAISWLEKASKLPQGEDDPYLRQLRSDLNLKRAEQELYTLKATENDEADNDDKERIEELDKNLNALRLDEAKKLVEQFPNDYGQRLNYGELLLKLGNVDGAIQQFQVSQRSPSLKLKSQVLLGRCFVSKKLYDLALEQLSAANESVKVMDSFKKDTLYLMALCYESLGDEEQAIKQFKAIYASDIGFRDVAQKVDAFYRKS